MTLAASAPAVFAARSAAVRPATRAATLYSGRYWAGSVNEALILVLFRDGQVAAEVRWSTKRRAWPRLVTVTTWACSACSAISARTFGAMPRR